LTALGRLASWLRFLALRYQRAALPWRAAPPLCWMAWLWWLSSQQQLPDLGGRIGGLLHNAAHVPAYALLGALLYLLLPGALRRRVSMAILAASAYGLADEIQQHFVPGRVCDPYDIVSDAMGAALACCWLGWQLCADQRCLKALPWLILGAAVAVAAGTWQPL
jgi:VanZ family protein